MARRVFRRWYAAYGFALLCVAVAIGLRTFFDLFDATLYFATFYPAMLVAALYAGTRAGVVALLLSLIYAWWAFVPPAYRFSPLSFAHVVNFVLFAVSSGIILWVAAMANSSARKLSLALDELVHRSKNTTAILESILKQSLAKEPELADSIVGRLRAITSANDLIGASADMQIDLKRLLDFKLKSFGRVQFSGPAVTLPPNVARNLSLIVHELGTNALKHGALSTPGGQVKLTWLDRDEALFLRWEEEGGPPVTAPQVRGFGTRLVTALVKGMGGTAKADFERDGLRVEISTPLSNNIAIAPAVWPQGAGEQGPV